VVTSGTLRIDMNMIHGKLLVVSTPGIEIDTDGLTLTYSKLKLKSDSSGTDPRLRIELAGSVLHGKIIERRPRRR